ncbi:hypothetical protein IM697_22085 [Streptomyces ferrugineus]|uniref:DUF397 domain-containing protein n=1 Tax=Streptomyces ferrugineus TaxID=1413221 RepID=A0A7M2SWT8_9ACTN|nr:hypothetical protein [Streptomyces ferrugineus]QOV40836.1 hypothetical protein IM697_22085 [Streptomyces ferrugineus]
MWRLEEFDEVAGGVGEKDLASARAGGVIAAERQPGRAQSSDLGIRVVDDDQPRQPVAALDGDGVHAFIARIDGLEVPA